MYDSKYSNLLTIVLIIIIIAIIALLSFLGIDYVRKYKVSKEASKAVQSYEENHNITGNNNIQEEQSNKIENEVADFNVIDSEISSNTNTSSSSTKKANTKTYKGYTLLGTIKIQSINLEYPIVAEVSTSALENAVIALYPSNGTRLNKPGNTVIIGHNYRNGLFFSNVKKLENGDKIYITTDDAKITYTVYNKFVTTDTDTSFYERDTNGKAEVTLSTCTDASNSQRQIVFARQS